MKKLTILNLTQHNASLEQKESGVIDLPENYRERLTKALTFEELPIEDDILSAGEAIKRLVIDFLEDDLSPIKEEATEARKNNNYSDLNLGFMIGGAPWLMSVLEYKLYPLGTVLYAFSKREVVEKEIDGKLKKVAFFKHLGFVEALPPC